MSRFWYIVLHIIMASDNVEAEINVQHYAPYRTHRLKYYEKNKHEGNIVWKKKAWKRK